jgi:hypothetical protein
LIKCSIDSNINLNNECANKNSSFLLIESNAINQMSPSTYSSSYSSSTSASSSSTTANGVYSSNKTELKLIPRNETIIGEKSIEKVLKQNNGSPEA